MVYSTEVIHEFTENWRLDSNIGWKCSLLPALSTNKGTEDGTQAFTHTRTWLNIGAAFGL